MPVSSEDTAQKCTRPARLCDVKLDFNYFFTTTSLRWWKIKVQASYPLNRAGSEALGWTPSFESFLFLV